jgi:hypothetical protein
MSAARTASGMESLQAALAAEHAAVWIYGALGAQSSRSAQPRLSSSLTRGYLTHRGRRDELIRAVRDAGAEPVAAAAGYEFPRESPATAGLAGTAAGIERWTAAIYADVVANTSGAQRAWAIAALTDAAVCELDYRGSPEIFPGLAEFADR